MYSVGHGVPLDAATAARWYLAAARAGHVGAQHIIASLYETGNGVAADRRLAAYWYLQAAQQGDAAAREKHTALMSQIDATTP